MSRAARLLDLLQALRRRRRPVAAQKLADELSVSLRTIYRDIETLTAQGAPIEGEPGVGFILHPGFTLPPLMFADDEIEALTLGCRFVLTRGDRRLAQAARDALAKIEAVLPSQARDRIAHSPLLAPPIEAGPRMRRQTPRGAPVAVNPETVRAAIAASRKARITYRDQNGEGTRRIIWPIAIAYFAKSLVLVAWCEKRNDFRHFRIDRIEKLVSLDERPPKSRMRLLKEWRAREDIPDFTEHGDNLTADRN